MGTVVAMTYQPIQEVSRGFAGAARTLRLVAKACKAIADFLKASFFGAILFAEVVRRMELIASKANKLAGICDEFSNDLNRAVLEHQNGDYKAGSYFGEGVRR